MKKQNLMKLSYITPPPKSQDEKYSDRPGDFSNWENWSLPLGNGYLGASVFGYTDIDRVQITENSLANPYKSYDAKPPVPNGRYGLNNFAELYFDFGHEDFCDYTRELDLDNATARIAYTSGGVRYEREYFASYPARCLVIRFSADREGSISFTAIPKIPFIGDYCLFPGDGCGKHGEVISEGDTITLRGTMDYYNISFEGQLKLIPEGGKITASKDTLHIEGADSVMAIFACGTNYKLESRVFTEGDPKRKLAPYPHPHECVSEMIREAHAKSFSELKEAHIVDYRELYDRVKISLDEEIPDIPTDKLVLEYGEGNESRYLELLLYHYGRYLLIASSRPGGLPANLQGIWNSYNTSPWSCGYWHNINVQMNYWQIGIANLSELFLPYSDYSEAYMDLARRHADEIIAEYYPEKLTCPGTNGWMIGTGAWPYTIGKFAANGHSGPGTGAFTSLLFWDYYDYTRDKEYLRRVCYPRLREMSIFYSKMLVESDGKLLIKYSASPEIIHNGEYYRTMGCAFDQQMVYENYKRTLEAASILGINEPIIDVIRSQMERLDPVLIGESGQVKEFREERFYGDIGEYTHRHISHLVGLYPATIINSTTKEWQRAAEVTLTERGDKSTCWAAVHRLCLWTRLGRADKSITLIRSLIKNNLFPNLWDRHPPFQIDGNLGYTAGVSEMLLQSQSGYIELLRSLPDEWASGAFSGLVARGNFTVDCVWENKRPVSVKVTSRAGEPLRIYDEHISAASLTLNGMALADAKLDGEILSLDTSVGDVLEITF